MHVYLPVMNATYAAIGEVLFLKPFPSYKFTNLTNRNPPYSLSLSKLKSLSR